MWPTVKVGDVTDIVSGGTPKSKVPEYWDGGVPWITPKDMGDVESTYVNTTSRTISETGLIRSSAKLIPSNSVILSTRAPIGHLVINEVAMSFNQGCRGLIPNDNLLVKYLYYHLLGRIDLLNQLGTGTTFLELSKSALAGVPIPLPPLPEQRRIVAVLDEAFEGIDKAIANTEQNLANARELFESYLDDLVRNSCDEWPVKQLNDVCSFENGDRGKNYPGRKAFVSSGVPFINAGHLDDGTIDMDAMNYIPQERFDLLGNGKVKNGDILFCLRGSLGKFGKVENFERGAIASSLVIVRPGDDILVDYLSAYFGSIVCRTMIKKFENGTAQPNLSARSLRHFEIPIPPTDVQKTQLLKLEEIRSKTRRLESLYQQKLDALAELKQSILQKAFSGGLTAREAAA